MVVVILLLFLLHVDCHLSYDYDYIIIGSGTGGVVATRLAEAKYKVLLIEAGPDDLNFSCQSCNSLPFGDYIAGSALLPLKGFWSGRVKDLNWMNTTSMKSYWNYNKTILNKTDHLSRAKMLGGCQSHNSHHWTRGSVRDYDHLNLESWSFNRVLPFFQKLETYLGENDTLRGKKGPIVLRNRLPQNFEHKLKAFVKTAIDYGLPYNNHQHGGYSQFGLGFGDANIAQYFNDKKGLFNTTFYRSSVAGAYIRNIGIPSGYLTIMYNTTAQRVLFNDNMSTPKAIGVEYYDPYDGNLDSVYCNKDVIISAGTYQSPQLLMLSGIGPIEKLNHLDIKLIKVNDMIGKYGQDHTYISMRYRVNSNYINNMTYLNKTVETFLNTTEYFYIGGSVRVFLSSNMYDRMGFDYNDISLYISNGGIYSDTMTVTIDSSIYSKNLTISLKNADSRTFPNVYNNYFTDSRDYDLAIKGIEQVRKIFAANQSIFIEEIEPGLSVTTDEQLRKWIFETSVSSLHAVGTVSMGVNETYPIDSKCSVRGVNGLRVIDVSIWPFSTNGGTMALSFLIGEKCAQHIIDDNADHTENWWNTQGIYIIICVIITVILVLMTVLYFNRKKRNNEFLKEDELAFLNKN
eukprot:160634_1